MSSEQVLLGLGANVGDRLETLAAAVHAIDDLDGVAVEDVSAVYETPPWPPPDDPRSVTQEPYYNLVVKAVTNLAPHALLAETQLLERAFGRDRAREARWGPRTLDIDLLLFGDRQIDTPDLVVPHPRIAERAFVLVPLLELLPGGALPDGRRLTGLLAALAPIEGIELVVRLEDLPGRRLERPEGPTAPPASFERPDVGDGRAGGR
ncbi:2-amino-4-hydroxy-6-hydroxymethyldihydropteridine diphosphokinase [Egicoccus sp. AB-alg2]|uniref:2-amino-4-hydroxy-6- hydroxymethyldihydropteridine diphosphokinase n=1 Tax=Egicoccus sp. AB-alg2 TaxID=3242693 RepID=UPI00359EE612